MAFRIARRNESTIRALPDMSKAFLALIAIALAVLIAALGFKAFIL
jgi:hypothetical protein